MWNKNIETFIGCESDFENAKIVMFGAPFDSTTSYRPGTRFGSRAIRSESYGLEVYSPYQDKEITDIDIFDGGDIELVELTDDNVVKVRLKGHCAGCPGARMTLTHVVQQIIQEAFPDLKGVEAVE